MAATKRKTESDRVDLQALTQVQAAALIGKRASWLRDRSDLAGRRSNGRYDAIKLVAAFVQSQIADAPQHKLSELDIHQIDQAVFFADALTNRRLLLETIDRIRQTPGGMAALGELLCEMLLAENTRGHDDEELHRDPPRTEQQIRQEVEAECEATIAQRLKREDERELRQSGRVVTRCPTCARYWYARKWRRGVPLEGFAVEDDVCEKCF